ncbi:acyl carrier protein [Streptomyces sp. NPDC050856]|uniref:acyl carrier protein n=1 Tax=unclassified Streptomyces TaxID=2593676 RepID=UPI0033EB8EB3
MNARELVAACLDNPLMLERIGDTEEFHAAGVNSGEVIRIALRCEEEIGRALDDDELAAVNTLEGIDLLLAEEAG